MSSVWKDDRNKPNNVFRDKPSLPWRANWGWGDFTCIHTMNEPEGPWWKVNFKDELVLVTKISILNRNDCCEGRLNGAKVYVGDQVFGTVSNAKKGDWTTMKGKLEGKYIKIVGAANQFLHFCGIKVYAKANEEKCKPEPPKPLGGIYEDEIGEKTDPEKLGCETPERIEMHSEQTSMSSMWKDDRVQPNNPYKSTTFNSNWGLGDFTCIHTQKDPDGAWWKVKFDKLDILVTKIAILNRNDCCEKRLKGVKVYVGDTLFGIINDPKKGDWTTLKSKVEGKYIKVQGTPNQYLHFCGIKVWAMADDDTCNPDPEPEPVIEPEPEPPKPCVDGIIIPANLKWNAPDITMSSTWKDERNHPCNPIKVTERFNANWGGG